MKAKRTQRIVMPQQIEYQMETHTRTWLKALSWRILGTLTTFAVTFSITNSFNIASTIGVLEFFAKTILFYLHERMWIKLNSFF